MSSMISRILVTGVTATLLLAGTMSASAQRQNRFPVQALNFYLWCQDTAKLPVAQCDQRRPEDVTRFEEHRAIIERYEIPYLQERENQTQLNRTILRNDPVGNPVSQSPEAQSQTPTPTRTQNPP